MTRTLIVATYLLACATAGTAVFLFGGVTTGLFTATVLALGCLQIDTALGRHKEKKITEREIAGLKRVTFQFEQALAETRAKMDDVSKAIEAKTEEHTSELQSR